MRHTWKAALIILLGWLLNSPISCINKPKPIVRKENQVSNPASTVEPPAALPSPQPAEDSMALPSKSNTLDDSKASLLETCRNELGGIVDGIDPTVADPSSVFSAEKNCKKTSVSKECYCLRFAGAEQTKCLDAYESLNACE